jgi:DNA-binding CsgD family transcriptional regulator
VPGRAYPHLLEREAELSELRAVIDGAREGAGQVAVVEGAAGAGKSALVAAATVYAAQAGLRVLSASGSELERAFAFGAVRQLLEPVLTAAPAAERERLLAGAAAPAEWVIALGVEGDVSRARAEAGFAVLHAIYWLATNAALEAPLLIAVDDLHWVDEPSLRSLAYLARRIADLPIALLAALRPAEPGAPAELLDELRTLPAVVMIAPRPLSRASVSEVVRAQLPAADEELCAAFHAASAGNPLYVRELLRSAAADGLLDDPGAAARVREASVPSLGERVVRRVARAAPEARALAIAMAVLGDGQSLQIAAGLAGLDGDTAAAVAHRLARIEVLAGEDPFAFVHPVVRRSVYDELSVTERHAAHAQAARMLREAGASAEAIAAHLSVLSPAGSDGVAATLLEAAQAALSRAAPDAAIAPLRRALEEEAAQPSRATLLFELGQAEMLVRDPAAAGHLEQALELAEEPRLRARTAVTLTELLCAAGQWQAALGVMAAAKRELGERDRELVVELEAVRAMTMAYDPKLVEDFDVERARFAELSAGDSWAAHALAALLAAVAAHRCEGSEKVLLMADRGLASGRLLGERGAGAWASAQVLWALVAIDEYERALSMAEHVAAEGRRSGSLLGVLTGTGYRGAIHARKGDLAAAETELRTILDVTAQSGMSLWLATAFHLFQDALVERPGLDDVAALAEKLELEPEFLATMGGAMLLEARGRMRLARRDRDRGLEDLRACAATYAPLRIGPTHSPWRSALALALPREEQATARELVAEELELARASGLARPQGVALRAAGMLEGGDRGIELLRQSASRLERSSARLEHARSLVELGAALRRRHQRAQARQQLTAGMELAHRCGAQRLAARADEELHAAGAKPRRLVQSGTDALTASELRVARLAAEGYSNLEIAQELYLSPKTVETHLSHAYAKLGLSGQGSRARLAQALTV